LITKLHHSTLAGASLAHLLHDGYTDQSLPWHRAGSGGTLAAALTAALIVPLVLILKPHLVNERALA
jgi:hypothetical protein